MHLLLSNDRFHSHLPAPLLREPSRAGKVHFGEIRSGELQLDLFQREATEFLQRRSPGANNGTQATSNAGNIGLQDTKWTFSSFLVLAKRIQERLEKGTALSNKELFTLAEEYLEGSLGEGAFVARTAYDALELASTGCFWPRSTTLRVRRVRPGRALPRSHDWRRFCRRRPTARPTQMHTSSSPRPPRLRSLQLGRAAFRICLREKVLQGRKTKERFSWSRARALGAFFSGASRLGRASSATKSVP